LDVDLSRERRSHRVKQPDNIIKEFLNEIEKPLIKKEVRLKK
jgi:hypothetical protein